MKYSESSINRIFVIRLEDGDAFPDCIENFSRKKSVKRGIVLFLGGIKGKSKIVMGPEKTEALPAVPIIKAISEAHEIVGVGTLFPDDEGNPILHAHASMGRDDETKTGCTRPGITTWHVLEVILLELTGECGIRVMEEPIGYKLLDPTAK